MLHGCDVEPDDMPALWRNKESLVNHVLMCVSVCVCVYIYIYIYIYIYMNASMRLKYDMPALWHNMKSLVLTMC